MNRVERRNGVLGRITLDFAVCATVGGSRLFSTLITDAGITPGQLAAFADNGIEVIVAS